MKKFIDFKNIIEWSNREMLCDRVSFFITQRDKKIDTNFDILRFENAIAIISEKRELIATIPMNDVFYTNRMLSAELKHILKLSGDCHITVVYKDLARDVKCFEFNVDKV
jgi:hypothetical protein